MWTQAVGHHIPQNSPENAGKWVRFVTFLFSLLEFVANLADRIWLASVKNISFVFLAGIVVLALQMGRSE